MIAGSFGGVMSTVAAPARSPLPTGVTFTDSAAIERLQAMARANRKEGRSFIPGSLGDFRPAHFFVRRFGHRLKAVFLQFDFGYRSAEAEERLRPDFEQ
jgi:hypothetical protein